MSIIIFDKTYTSQSIIDLNLDILDVEENALRYEAEYDQYGFIKGKFRVTVEWIKEE